MKTVRVLLVDDHALVRSGIRSLLEDLPQIDVVGEAANGREALELAKRQQPDVVLMDIAMPGLNGLEALKRLSRTARKARVLMLSMHANEEYVLHALRNGAQGYLLKDAAPSELEVAVRAVAGGEMYLSPMLSRYVIGEHLQRHRVPVRALDRLTSRQREVLQLIAEGRTTKDIATALGLSVKTIETHRMDLMKRLDIHDVAGLVRYAIRIGLVSPEP